MEDTQLGQPLLAQPTPAEPHHENRQDTAVFSTKAEDIPPIASFRDFQREFYIETKKLWYLAGPAIFTSLAQYSLGAITQVFAGHVGTIELAAVSVENSVIAGFSFGVMLGMGSALETLCGQAFGAGQLDLLGVYVQRSWLILNFTALLLCLLYVFAERILKAIGQTTAISEAAGIFAVWMIPQLFAYAMNFPIQKFLQSQSKIMVMAWISAVGLVLHAVVSWLLMLKLEWGLAGAAVVLNSSWWFIVLAQLVYILSGTCGRAWNGFSMKAFQNLWGFVRLSIASAVMLCLETWYFMAIILFAGYLKNAEISVDALSICMNILGWTITFSFGINAACESVKRTRSCSPKNGKIFTCGCFQDLVVELTPMLASCIVINNIQPVLSGVAIGAGWQTAVAYVNLACYYLFGVPAGLLLGYKLNYGVLGIWSGMLAGTILQTAVLTLMIYRTNWSREASLAEDRIKQWGGLDKDLKANDIEKTREKAGFILS